MAGVPGSIPGWARVFPKNLLLYFERRSHRFMWLHIPVTLLITIFAKF